MNHDFWMSQLQIFNQFLGLGIPGYDEWTAIQHLLKGLLADFMINGADTGIIQNDRNALFLAKRGKPCNGFEVVDKGIIKFPVKQDVIGNQHHFSIGHGPEHGPTQIFQGKVPWHHTHGTDGVVAEMRLNKTCV